MSYKIRGILLLIIAGGIATGHVQKWIHFTDIFNEMVVFLLFSILGIMYLLVKPDPDCTQK